MENSDHELMSDSNDPFDKYRHFSEKGIFPAKTMSAFSGLRKPGKPCPIGISINRSQAQTD